MTELAAEVQTSSLSSESAYVYACTRRGASHRSSGTACQDAHALWFGTELGHPLIIACVADGHGSAQHDLSRYGAQMAVDAAVTQLRALSRNCSSSLQALVNGFRNDFPRLLQRDWQSRVEKDVSRRQIAEHDEERLLRRYGTTLLAALVTAEGILVGQRGDGDIVAANAQAGARSPLPRSVQLTGQSTYSLSSQDAPRLWVTGLLSRHDVDFLLLSTDGLSNSFGDGRTDAGFHRFVESLRDRVVEFSPQRVSQDLPQWLESYSENGSGDDMTAAFLFLGTPATTPAGTPAIETERIRSASATGNQSQESVDFPVRSDIIAEQEEDKIAGATADAKTEATEAAQGAPADDADDLHRNSDDEAREKAVHPITGGAGYPPRAP